MKTLEKVYGKAFKTVLWAVNPFKKIFKKTLCEVHVFINNNALEILKNDGHTAEYEFFGRYRGSMNEGVVWADQDFRSREHFYNPYTHRGLYGCKSSKQRFREYFQKALVYWDNKDEEKAMFYLGAATHLIQDATIPQHGSVNLLKSHRGYEQWVKGVHDNFSHYSVRRGGVYYSSPYDYIDKNAKRSIELFRKYSLINDNSERYFKTTSVLLPLAQKTTAGCLLNFYNMINQ